MFQRAADRAIDIMAAGIQDDLELEAILAKARPESRERLRARFEPHLTYRKRSPIVQPLAESIRDPMKADGCAHKQNLHKSSSAYDCRNIHAPAIAPDAF